MPARKLTHKKSPSGDVDFERVEPVVQAVTPVPGGVGAVTTSVLAENLLKAAKLLS